MPVGEMLARMSSAELTAWMVYEQETGPLDHGRRADYLAGVIASTIANVNRAKGPRYKPEAFIPEWGGRRRQTWQEQLAIVETMNRALGGKDHRPVKPRI